MIITNSQWLPVPSLHSFSRGQNKKFEDISRTIAPRWGRGQFFKAESEAEDKSVASRPACPRRLNITDCSQNGVCLWTGDSSSGVAIPWRWDSPQRMECVLQLLHWSFQVKIQTYSSVSRVQSRLRGWHSHWPTRSSYWQGPAFVQRIQFYTHSLAIHCL